MSLTEVLSKGSAADDARTTMEFEKLRLELCWRHFDFHARQRTQLFHFFIILAPFAFGGCFLLFKERASMGDWPSVVAALSGALVSVIFFSLDRRNKQLYLVSKRALMIIETQLLFTSFRALTGPDGHFPGVLTKEDQLHGGQVFHTHSFLIGATYCLALILFLVLTSYFLLVHCGCAAPPQATILPG
jgi:hypothetical protein